MLRYPFPIHRKVCFCDLPNHYFCSPWTAALGARIRLWALLPAGITRSSVGFLASCLAIAPVFLERDVFVTCPLRNHYFYSPSTTPFGARIRFRAILHKGSRTSCAVFWFHASISLSYSLKGVFLLDVPCQITFCSPLAAPFGARIRFRALPPGGTTRSRLVF